MGLWTVDTPEVGAVVSLELSDTLYGPMYFNKHLRTEHPFASPHSEHLFLSYQWRKEKIVFFSLKATQENARSIMKLHSILFDSLSSHLGASFGVLADRILRFP